MTNTSVNSTPRQQQGAGRRKSQIPTKLPHSFESPNRFDALGDSDEEGETTATPDVNPPPPPQQTPQRETSAAPTATSHDDNSTPAVEGQQQSTDSGEDETNPRNVPPIVVYQLEGYTKLNKAIKDKISGPLKAIFRGDSVKCPMDPNNSCLTAKEDVVPTDRTLSAAASATPPAYSDTASTVGASCAPSGYHPISAVELFVIMNRAAKPTTPAEKEAAEKAYKLFVRHELSAALAQLPPTEASYLLSGLPRSALEEVIVPPGVLPGVATQDAAAPAEAAPSGVASPDVATQEASALLIAPTDNSSEEAASAPVLAVQGLTDSDHPNPTRHPTTPVLLEIPEANLGTLLSAEMPMDAQQASRKRPATSDSEEQTAATAPEGRQTKKKAAAADAPTAPPTAEEDGFTVPNRRHTAKPKRLEKVLAPPPATSNRFAEATEVVMEAEPAAPARKQTRPPPVIVTWDDEFMDLRRMIKEVVEVKWNGVVAVVVCIFLQQRFCLLIDVIDTLGVHSLIQRTKVDFK
ncbi:uncharacterized protein LOC124545544 [Schistocerca americana]|uniref:uncharacterized protein LOC124545544 n=1 Tax=Schistocerca americana TaxID=7009 RepID=UPI001F503A94|nr:uncharacterized protein LOC124545544 [Schistocerca americana]